MKTTAWVRNALPAALLLVVMAAMVPVAAIEVSVSINIVDMAGQLDHPAGQRQSSALAALMAEEHRDAEAAQGFAVSEHRDSRALKRQAIEQCYNQLPAGYRALHESRFVRQWGALGGYAVMDRMLREWQRLNELPCAQSQGPA